MGIASGERAGCEHPLGEIFHFFERGMCVCVCVCEEGEVRIAAVLSLLLGPDRSFRCTLSFSAILLLLLSSP